MPFPVNHTGDALGESLLNHTLGRDVWRALLRDGYEVRLERDECAGNAVRNAEGRYQVHMHAKPLPFQLVFLGNEIKVEGLTVPQQGDGRALHAAWRILALTQRGYHAQATVAENTMALSTNPIVHVHKSATLGPGARLHLHVALWEGDGATVFPGCAEIYVFNAHKNVTLVAEQSLLDAVMAGLMAGRAALALRLEQHLADESLRGEWMQQHTEDNPWQSRYHLTVLLKMTTNTTDPEMVDGTCFRKDWQQRVYKKARAVSQSLAVRMEERRVAENHRARYERIRQHLARQAAQIVDAWVTEIGPGRFRDRFMETMTEIETDEDRKHETVRAWIQHRIIQSLPRDEEE